MELAGFFALALVLAGLSAVYVLAPVLGVGVRRRGQHQEEQDRESLEPVINGELDQARSLEQRENALQALAELDRDYAAGDLNEADYLELRSACKQQAVDALVELDRLEDRRKGIDQEIEAAILAARSQVETGTVSKDRQNRPAAGQRLNRPRHSPGVAVTTYRPTSQSQGRIYERYCEKCRHESSLSAIFCSSCGARLPGLEE